ncbi:hypothetical protein [Pyxidicoccus trucidator]|uniref:hypothetical protein n=1 Tax=Pyxidicoccus trucidator TaxID=2709662 RepID=UPI001F082491|nr:hypothetical protein [Pyxidicoccus trucidator]
MTTRRGLRLTRGALVLISVLGAALPARARAAEPVDTPYYEDRRALSLIIGPGGSYTDYIDADDDDAESGGDAHLDLAGTRTVGYDGDELFVLIRGSLRGPDLSLVGGYRNFFGMDAWQSFFDLSVMIRPFSGPWVGPRVAFGARHTFSERLAVFGGLGLTLGFGSGLRADAEVFTGVQWIFPVGKTQ